jgi:hypothetical protein
MLEAGATARVGPGQHLRVANAGTHVLVALRLLVPPRERLEAVS